MKKIYSLPLLLLGVLGFSSCSDDTDNPYASESTIAVVKSDLTFDAVADSGSVVFTSTGNVTVTTSASWCKATLSGDSVIVTVAQNNSKNGRAASVTLHNGTDSLNLAVLQQGVVTKMEKSTVSLDTDEATSLSYGFSCSLNLAVASCPDWVSARINGDSLYVDVEANNTGHLRSGYIVYKSDAYVDSIRVFQADFDRDIAGKYNICYQRGSDDPTEVTLRNKALSKTSLYVLNTLSLPLTYDGGTITVQAGSYMGTNSNNGTTTYVYLAFGMAGNYWTGYTNTTSTVSADLNYNDVDGTYAEFKGNISGMEFISFIFRRYSAQSISESNDLGSAVYTMYHPVIKRAPATTASAGVSGYITRK